MAEQLHHLSTTIHFVLHQPLDPGAMSLAVYSTYMYIEKVIGANGDGPLPPNEDPFVYNQRHGAFVDAWSAPGQKMTWSLLEGAVVGLWNDLYLRDKYRVTSFTLWVAGTGLVGVGNLCADDRYAFSPIPNTNRTANLSNVT